MILELLDRAFNTKDTMSDQDYRQAGRALIADGACSSSMATLQGGPFLAAFAIALGASNYEVGLLATIGFLSQFAQLGGLLLVQKYPRRRGIVLPAESSRNSPVPFQVWPRLRFRLPPRHNRHQPPDPV